MKNLINKLKNEKLHTRLLPLIFQGQILLNIIFSVITPSLNDNYRKLLVYGFLFLIMTICLINIDLKQCKYHREITFAVAIYFVIKIVMYSKMRLWTFEGLLSDVLPDMFPFILLIVGLLSIVTSKREIEFLKSLYIFSCVIGIMCIIYVLYEFICAPESTDIGYVSYMSIAYLLVTHMIFIIILLMYGSLSNIKCSILVICGAIICIATFITGCKGAVLCLIVAMLFIVCTFVFWRKNDKLVIHSCTIYLFILVAMFFIPNSNSRVQSFVTEVSDNYNTEVSDNYNTEVKDNYNTEVNDNTEVRPEVSITNIFNCLEWSNELYTESQEVFLRHPEIGQDLPPSGIIPEYVFYSDYFNMDYKKGLINDQEYMNILADAKILNHTHSGVRIFLWATAINEIDNSPVVGNGLGYYQEKYKIYPHNVILEAWCDLGLIGLVFILLTLCSFVYITIQILKWFNNNEKDYFTLFWWLYVLLFGVNNMISSSFYSYDLSFKYLICIMLAIKLFYNRNVKNI